MSKNNWKSYNLAQAKKPARPRLVRALNNFVIHLDSQHALDLGCGSGRDTFELCKRGWQVDAVDSNKDSIELAQKTLHEIDPSNKVTFVQSQFEDLKLEKNKYDLINASYSLPFCQPKFFSQFWQQISESLKVNSIFTFELFGDKDSWNSRFNNQNMTFLSSTEVSNLILPFQILEFEEFEKEGPSFSEPSKYWHYFEITVRKK